jgi:hypothetical protein
VRTIQDVIAGSGTQAVKSTLASTRRPHSLTGVGSGETDAERTADGKKNRTRIYSRAARKDVLKNRN